MSAARTASSAEIKDANARYHDVAASDYDSKWGIDFGPVGQQQVRAKMSKALGDWPPAPFGDALEIGAGTGYFSLNLLQLGLVRRATATDISPGMLASLRGSAGELGLEIATVGAEAEELPFGDESFDLVFGHAVLHHIPDLDRAFAEFRRVLRPGGRLAFCGEPSRYGDALAALPKRVALTIAPVWRRAMGVGRRRHDGYDDDGKPDPASPHSLEAVVDVHSFRPGNLKGRLEASGFGGVRVRGEELLANAYGWGVRTLESTAEPAGVPTAWRNFAFRSYLALQRVDSALLEPRLPPELFYNLVLSATKPG
jgi:ubiquinone/menaquinone biosynthesis C-methylase UbiE